MENNKHLGWKCKNAECGKTFFLPGRVTKEVKPAMSSGFSSLEINTREIRESPCCPFCFHTEFEPCEIEVKLS